MKCWGNNEYKQLQVPVGVDMDVYQMFSGYYHTCITTMDGQIKCWGRNHKGQTTFHIHTLINQDIEHYTTIQHKKGKIEELEEDVRKKDREIEKREREIEQIN